MLVPALSPISIGAFGLSCQIASLLIGREAISRHPDWPRNPIVLEPARRAMASSISRPGADRCPGGADIAGPSISSRLPMMNTVALRTLVRGNGFDGNGISEWETRTSSRSRCPFSIGLLSRR
ncbi:hypothetical protein [Bradyrhizobium betae]|uniref:Uncharacterized protein n=1 Tax=Bradyrhizobium betae TaxID=244734 RepID=A0A5P6P3Q7_9BRAD|nr:hypothetical protein [Bradyrhizobium betae]MCS3728503.1 hypothetical protein [Bradyrhizobium betae]QFI72835.1 hypothetical protein F8237_10745 [Bradyrhizobium betae]